MATALASRIRDTGERVDTARAFAPQDTLVTPQSHDIVVCALEDVTLQKIFDVVDECLRRDIGCLLVVVTGARIQVGPVITVSNRPLLERISQGLSRASNEDNQPAEKLRFMKVHDTAIVDAQCLSAAADYVANLMQTGWSDQYWKSRVFGPQGISEQSHFNDESLQLIASHAPRLQGSATYDAAASLHRLTAGLVLPQRAQIESIGIVGGGTAGYLTALALKKFYPRKRITLLESSQIPVIGVGEATTLLMVAFLHNILGLDPVELYQAVRPTWKLGIRFEWGPNRRSHFNYPFGQFDPYPRKPLEKTSTPVVCTA